MAESFNYRCALPWVMSPAKKRLIVFEFSHPRGENGIIELLVVECVMDYCASPKEKNKKTKERRRKREGEGEGGWEREDEKARDV